jgi:hypothetical protein
MGVCATALTGFSKDSAIDQAPASWREGFCIQSAADEPQLILVNVSNAQPT